LACFELIARAGHGVLSTVFAGTTIQRESRAEVRVIDSVPVVFAVRGRDVLLPIDTVKPKKSTALQRIRNLEADPRCTLLVEKYDDDWDDLWWVRIHGSAEIHNSGPAELKLLGESHPQYSEPGSIAGLIVLTPAIVTGWRSRAGTPHPI
jgi:PPOX class probable F420-dependent enzyme